LETPKLAPVKIRFLAGSRPGALFPLASCTAKSVPLSQQPDSWMPPIVLLSKCRMS